MLAGTAMGHGELLSGAESSGQEVILLQTSPIW